ncbi:MAG TPA: ATP-binding protein [Actinomycetota bacterium]
MALGLPLTINLRDRVTAELTNNALIATQGVVAAIDQDDLEPSPALDEFILDAADRSEARVLVLVADGTVIADSDGIAVGQNYDEPGRPEIVAALHEGRSISDIRTSRDLGSDLMATAVPIRDEAGRVVGAVRITQDVTEVNEGVRRVTLGLVVIGGAALLAGLILAFALAGSLSRPLTRLAAAAWRLGSGDLTARAEQVGGAREIQELGHSFDEMADRLERTVQAQREFVANASHQLRTPLTGMKLRLESAIADAGDDGVRRELEAAEREVDRLSAIVDRLLETSRQVEEGHSTQVDLDEAAVRAVERWSERAEQRRSTLERTGRGTIAQGDPSDLDQILDNLLDNATAYAPGEIVIETGERDGRAFVSVTDRGPGVADDEVGRVTERFYRGRGAPPGGSGLGLAIVRDLAERWGGSVTVTSRPGEGVRVEVLLRSSSQPP